MRKEPRELILLAEAPSGRVFDANRTACIKLGTRRDRLLGKSILEIVDPPLAKAITRLLAAETPTAEASQALTGNLLRQDGTPLRVVVTLKRSVLGGTAFLALVGRDVESSRLAEDLAAKETGFVPFLIQASPAFFVALGEDGRTLMMNRSLLDALGYELAEVAGKDYLAGFVPEEDRRPLARAFKALVSNRRAVEIESRLQARDGGRLMVEWHGSPVFREEGGLDFFFLVGQDITETRGMEKALLESLDRYRTLINDVLDSSAVGVFFLASDRRVVWINKVLEGYFGLKREEVIGRSMSDLIQTRIKHIFENPEDFAARVLSSFWAGTFVSGYECRVLPAEGRQERWLEHWSQPISSGLYAGGRIEHYHDITQRKRAEEALAASEEKYRELVQNANSIIMRRDLRGRVTFINEFASRFFGYREEEILGRNVVGTIVPERDSQGRDLQGMIRDIGEHPEQYEVNENENVCRDGRRVWIAWTNKAIRDREGKVTEVLCVGNDVSERKALQERLLQSKEMEAVGRLAGGIAHDFNNLLTGILGCAELMLMKLDGEHPLRRKAEQIRQSAEKGARLTRQLQEFSQRRYVEPKPLDLNTVVAGMREVLRGTLGPEVELDLDLGSDLGAVKADPGDLEQVLLQLAANAGEAMPEGGRFTVRTRNAEPTGDQTSGEWVELTASDTGIGMDEETRAHIFEPFFTTKGGGQGFGLGLATVYGIVKQNRGHIQVVGESGRGSSFQIRLPRSPEAPAQPRAAVMPAAPFRDLETVLVVEEREQVRRLFREALEKRGYVVLEARDSVEATMVCRRHLGPIHLLVTEILTPKGAGPGLTGTLSPLRPEMKVLSFSALGQGFGNPAGGDRRIAGPEETFTPESISRRIREVLDGARHGRA